MEIENTETIVPIICPNKIPEMIKIGVPKPSNAIQIIANIEICFLEIQIKIQKKYPLHQV